MNLQMPVIRRSRYILRDILPSDYLDLYAYGKDEETTRYVTWGPLTNAMQALWNIENIFYKRPQSGAPVGYAIIEPKEGKMIGQVDFHTINHRKKCGELGFILHKDYWNRGIMTSVVKDMIQLGFEYLGLNKILIGHVRENIASQRVIFKSGFSYESMKRFAFEDKYTKQLHDILYYSIYKHDYESGYLK